MISSSNNLHISEFSVEGLNVVKDHRVMTYLHGLSDFWASMFGDTDKINLLMGANSVTASEVYSKFLQLTCGIALEELSHISFSQIELLFLKTSDIVPGAVNTYYLPSKLADCRLISNKPFLPTAVLERDVDFHIEPNGTISFSKLLSEYQLPFRLNSEGGKEYALWVVDGYTDSDLIYDNYASLINIDKPERTSENFKNFIYGLFFLYVHGPNLDLIRRGLNLTLGIPLARDKEQVLEIRKYLTSDQFIVITDLNSYIIPYGLAPSVQEGDYLTVGSEIAQWVEVKDYINDGDWWINYMIPSHILPHMPTDLSDRTRYATEGSYADYLMRNYLKNHTFLVNVKTVGFKNIQSFEQLSDIIRRVKPSYTTPIYVWTVPIEDEIININDEEFSITANVNRCEAVTSGMYRFKRDSTIPLKRDCPSFTRFSVPEALDDISGEAPELNGYPRVFSNGMVTGYVAAPKQFRDLSSYEKAWLRAITKRNNSHYLPPKSKISFHKNIPLEIHGTGFDPVVDMFPNKRLICLHTTTMTDVLDKYSFAGLDVPNSYIMTLFEPSFEVNGINEFPLNSSESLDFYNFVITNFDKFFDRGSNISYLGPFCAKDNKRVFKPSPSDFREGDFFVFVKIVDYTVGVFWATSNTDIVTPPYWSHSSDDVLTVQIDGKLHRGMGHLVSPAYILRGAGQTVMYTEGSSVNTKAINELETPASSVEKVLYQDHINSEMFMDRSGRGFKIRKTNR